MEEQINIFGETVKEEPCENCYACRHFAEFKEPRTFAERGGEFTVFGMCGKGVGKYGSYTFYSVYVPGGKCKDFKKKRRNDESRAY